MIKKFHLYHDAGGSFRLVEMCCGSPSAGDTVRGERSVARTLRGLFPSLKNLAKKLAWDGFEISPRPPKRGAKEGSGKLTPTENSALRDFCAKL